MIEDTSFSLDPLGCGLRAVHSGHAPKKMEFVLECVRFITDTDEWRAKGGKLEHVGYVQAIFQSKKEAASYYDRHNPHLRRLNAYKTWSSDWDPVTHLKYIVREHHRVIQTIPPFDTREESEGCIRYKRRRPNP